MVAKGHDFQRVTLVGVVSADSQLSLPDFRAAERTFQLLTQVAGRAGRGALPGEVLVETFYPEHYAIQLAARQDYLAFFERELRVSAAAALPAIHGAGQRAGARHENRKCDPVVAAIVGVSRAAGIARRESAGSRRRTAGATQTRVSLPVLAEGAEALAAHARCLGPAGVQRRKGNSREGCPSGCGPAEFVLGSVDFSLRGFF